MRLPCKMKIEKAVYTKKLEEAEKCGFSNGLEAGKQAIREGLWFELSLPDNFYRTRREFYYELAYQAGWNSAS